MPTGMTERRPGSGWSRVARLAAILVLVAVSGAILVHTPAVRRYALERAIAALPDTIVLRADSLEYNLFTMRARLNGVRLASSATPEAPFFTADRVTVALRGSLLGRALAGFALGPEDRIVIERGRVRIVRRAGGRSNLPAGRGGGGEPAALRLGVVDAPRFAFEFVDEDSRMTLALPATDLLIEEQDGRIAARESGTFSRAGTRTAIRELQGRIRFDGRHLGLNGLRVRLEEAAAAVDGTVSLLTAQPGLDVTIRGTGDVPRLARWGGVAEPPRGEAAFEAHISGPFDAMTADAVVRVPALSWRDTSATNLTAVLRLTADRLVVERADAGLFGGHVNAAMRVPLAGGETDVTASWTDLDLERIARTFARDLTPRPTGRVSGSLEGRGAGAEWTRWTAQATARTTGGTTGRDRVALEGTLTLAVADGRWRARADQRVSGIFVHAALNGAFNPERLERSTLRGAVTLPPTPPKALLDVLRRTGTLTAAVPGSDGTIRAEATLGGTVGAPALLARGEASLTDVGAFAPETPLGGPADVQFEATLRQLRVQGRLADFNTRIEGTILTQAPYFAELRAEASEVDVGRLLRGIRTPVPIAGVATATAHATLALEDWRRARASVEIASVTAQAGALPIRLTAPARVSYADRRIGVQSLELLAGDTRWSAQGDLALGDPGGGAAPALMVTATGDLAQFTNAAAATGLVTLPDVSGTGPAALLARITGSIEAPRVSADLELGPGTLRAGDLPPATGVELRAHSDGEWIELRRLAGEWQGSRIEASGGAPVAWTGLKVAARPEPATLAARVSSVTPKALAPFLDADTVAQIEGSLDASLELRAAAPDLQSVSGFVQLDRMDVRVADLPIAQRVPTRIAVDRGFAEVAAWEWTGQGGTLGVRGRVRLEDGQAALLATGRFDLRLLTPFVRDAGLTVAGMAEPRISITGALADPRVDGDLLISAAEARLLNPRIVATDIEARAVLTRTTAHLTRLSGSMNGGRLGGTGRVEFAPRSPIDAAFAMTVDGMALEFPAGLRTELDAVIDVALVVPPSDAAASEGSIRGTVTVRRGAYREPIAVVAGLLSALRTRRVAAAVLREPSLADRLTLDVRVLTDEDVVVDTNLAQLEFGTDLRVIGTVAAPSLAGRAELREGGRLYLGRNIYTLQSGSIDFANPDTIEPDLDIRARTHAGGDEIELTLSGTLDNLQRELRSITEPARGEADIVSLLLTGRTFEQISGREGEIVGEQVVGYLSGDILGVTGRAVGLDTLRLGGVDPADVATQLDPTTRLTFGKSIGSTLDVTYSQSLRKGDAQAWIVQYRPFNAVELRLTSDDDTLRSYEFRHRLSVGGGPGPVRPEEGSRRRKLRVDDISLSGALVLPEERLRAVLELERGHEFDFADWQADRDRLIAVYHQEGFLEARIAARRQQHDAAVSLQYDITAGPRTAIVATGVDLSPETIRRIREAWTGAVVDEFLVEEVRTIVGAALAREGYLAAKVDVSVARQPGSGGAPETKSLMIAVEPGPRVTETGVTVDAPDAALAEEILAWMKAGGLDRRSASEPAAVAQAVTAYLRSNGYLAARVTIGAPVLHGAEARVRVEVEPGERFAIGDVRFPGAARVETAALLEASGLTPGAPFDPAAVDRARMQILREYRRRGFAQTRVEVRQEPADTGAVTVTFSIAEGPRQVVAEIDVQGTRSIEEDVVTRALNLRLNEPVGAQDWLEARRRLFDTGLFRRVDLASEPAGPASADGETQPMRARVTVQEWPALTLRYGFQVSEQRPEGEVEGRDLVPGLSADLTRRTLFGRAITLGAAFDYQRREQAGRAFISAPTMLGWPIESVLVGERARETFAAETRVTDTTGVSLEQRFRFVRRLRLSYAYRFTRDHTFDTGPPDPILGPRDFTVNVARLNATAAFDTRDDPADTTRGILLSSSFDYAPAMLGSEFRFIKNLAQAYYFRPWRGVVLASAARFGLASALDDQELLIAERFKAGGSRTVRGAREDGLGPSDFFGPTGGEAILVFNQEVRFPLYRWLRGVGFVDAGNVFERRSNIDLGGLAASGGFGLRLTTPFALFRVDYGRLFSPGTDDRSGRWYFGIGQAF